MRTLAYTKDEQTGNTEERILKQAMRLFLEKGYHGTSIDDITQAAGLTKGALYWHFRSKDDLLKRIVEAFDKHFLDGLIKALKEAKGGAVDKLEMLSRYNAAFAYYNPELCVSFTTLAAELVGAHHKIEIEIKRIYKKYQNLLLNLVLQGKKEKVFRKEIDSDITALIIMAFHDGVLLHWYMNKSEINGEVLANTFREIVLNGVKG
jgi:AcrR family transcriptional regulator